MLINFRGDLIRSMTALGHEVVAACPGAMDEPLLGQLSVRYRNVFFRGTGTNPFADLKLVWELRNLMLDERPDIVFAYAIKPVVYSAIAARLAGVSSVYSMITGLGYVFVGTGLKNRCLRLIARSLYRIALGISSRVLFQNPDDLRDFVRWRLVPGSKCVLVNGSGVNMKHFAPVPMPKEDAFVMVARLIRDKGVLEYLEAAKRVKRAYPNTRFMLAGPFDSNPNSLSQHEISPFVENGVIDYLSEVDDVRAVLTASSIFVLPSYREGIPRSTLEAMAMGRPIITTDAPGCRETVVDGINGFLIAPRDVDDLASKMVWMLEHREAAVHMGEESIRICAAKFDVEKINRVMLNAMGLLAQELA